MSLYRGLCRCLAGSRVLFAGTARSGWLGWRRYLGTAFRRFSDCKKKVSSLLPANVYASIGEYLVILPLEDME
jgi:hypothetical protein